MKTVDAKTAMDMLQSTDCILIDIREAEEYAKNAIPGSINIPLSRLERTSIDDIPQSTAIFHCKIGQRTQMAEPLLQQLGFKHNYCLEGGMISWIQAGFEIQAKPSDSK